eukprot:gene7415-6956_t
MKATQGAREEAHKAVSRAFADGGVSCALRALEDPSWAAEKNLFTPAPPYIAAMPKPNPEGALSQNEAEDIVAYVTQDTFRAL